MSRLVSPKTIVTVDGLDGSGKSTFARGLIAAFTKAGVRSVVVRVDDFRRPIEWGTAASESDVYYDAYYDLALCESSLAAFLAGAPGTTIPKFELASERIEGFRPLVFEGCSVAVVEGVFPLRIPSAAAGMQIYLDTSETEARRRIIARDLQKGRTREEIERRIDRRYFPSQARYRAAFGPRERADVIIDNEAPAAARALRRELGRLPAALQPILDQALPLLR